MNNEKPYHLMMMEQKPKKKSKEQMMKETFIMTSSIKGKKTNKVVKPS